MTAFQRTLLNVATGEQLVPPKRVTASGNETAIDLLDYEGTAMITSAYSAGGSGATLDLSLEESDASGSGFAAVAVAQIGGGAFTQHANTLLVQQRTIDVTARKRYVRIAKTIGGTAAFDGAVLLHGIKKYVS